MAIQLSGSLEISGSIVATGGITISGSIASASYAQSSSLAENSNLLSGRNVNRFATTGSNSFNGNQTVTGSLTVTGQVIAQTLNVQQVTSSVVYSSGSNVFGNSIANTHQFTGSVLVTGSVAIDVAPSAWSSRTALQLAGDSYIVSSNPNLILGANVFFNGANRSYITTGVATDYRQIGGEHRWEIAPSGTANTTISFNTAMVLNASGSLGIGTTTPNLQLEIGGGTTVSTRIRLNRGSDDASQYSTIGWNSFNVHRANVAVAGSQTDFSINQIGSDGTRTPFYIDSLGNTGISTVNPTTKLEIERFETVNRTSYSDILTISAKSNTLPFDGHGGGILFRGSNYWNNNANVNYARIGSTINSNSTFTYGSDLFFDVASTSAGTLSRAMTIRYNGNVGIGTATPSTSLHIVRALGTDAFAIGESVSSIRFSIGQEASYTGNFINSRNIDLKIQSYLAGGSGGNIIFQTANDNTSNVVERMRINSAGNVGIGTSVPNFTEANRRTLDINGTSSAGIGLSAGGALYGYVYANSSVALIGSSGAIPLELQTNSATKVTITSGGKVLIGSADGNYGDLVASSNAASSYTVASIRNMATGAGNAVQGSELKFYGDIGYSWDIPTGYIRVISNSGGNNGHGAMTFGTHNGANATPERMRITTTGAVLVNTTIADVGGTVNGIALIPDNKILVSNNTTGVGSFLFYGDRRGTNNEGPVYMLAMGGFYKSAIGVIGTNNTTNNGGISFSTIVDNLTVTERVRVTTTGLLNTSGRISNAHTLGNMQEWVGTFSLANNTTISLFNILNQYDILTGDLYVFIDIGSYMAYTSRFMMGYTVSSSLQVTSQIGAPSGGFGISAGGTLYNETMFFQNTSGSNSNVVRVCLRVWGYGVASNLSTGGADLITSSYLTRIR